MLARMEQLLCWVVSAIELGRLDGQKFLVRRLELLGSRQRLGLLHQAFLPLHLISQLISEIFLQNFLLVQQRLN